MDIKVKTSDNKLSQREKRHSNARLPAITRRAVLIGSIGAVLIGLIEPYAINVVKGSYMALDFSTPAALALFFFVTALLNRVLRRLHNGFTLKSGELAVVYTMMVLASAIPSIGLTAQLLPIITAPFYFSAARNPWIDIAQQDLKPWLYMSNPDAVKGFYEGIRGTTIPWGAWMQPLLAWIPFIFALFVVMICLSVILRRQWSEKERLSYPLIQLPLELTREDISGGVPILKKYLFWIGFGVAFIFGSFIGLHFYYPSVPSLNFNTQFAAFDRNHDFFIRLSFPMLGFFYLVNLDVLFSLWFFNLIFQISDGLLLMYGFEWKENMGSFGTPSALFAHLGMGAITMYVVMGAYVGRDHFKKVLHTLIARKSEIDDSGEIMSYRTAAWGCLLGLIFMTGWLIWSGMPYFVAPLFLFGAAILFVGLTRLVVECGLAEAVVSTTPSGFVFSGFGSRLIGPRGMLSLGLSYVWASDLRTSVMASASHGIELFHRRHHNSRRGFFLIMALAIILAMASSGWLTMHQAYKYGGANLNVWFFNASPQLPYQWAVANIENPSAPNIWGWMVTAAGAGIMFWFSGLRMQFANWPLHPVGFAVGNVWIMNHLILTLFLAWLIKLLIVRYGGLRGYRTFMPFFMGLIVGQYTCNILWFVIDLLTGQKGNLIFWI